MRVLELKVPPPAVMVLIGALMWLVSRAAPGFGFRLPAHILLGVGVFLIGFATGMTGVATFRRAKTTLNPTTPASASAMVNWGIYAVTRNPMYLGGFVMLTGWAIFLSNPLVLLLLPAYVAYINRFQIEPEERALTSLFGDEFTTYKSRVRRWI